MSVLFREHEKKYEQARDGRRQPELLTDYEKHYCGICNGIVMVDELRDEEDGTFTY
jgi:hypothetical protein